MANRKLAFIVGGVQKAGTSALHAYLTQHPGLLGGPDKEFHFFDNEKLDWTNPDYSLLECGGPADGWEARTTFDATPIYLFWPNALERIAAYNNQVKLIFIFRDPIERAWSHWCMETSRAVETLSFSEAIREGRRRLDGVPPNDDRFRVYTYVERGFYGRQLHRVLDLFPRENLLLLTSEQLRHQHQSTLDRVSDFLGIPPFPQLNALEVFVGSREGELVAQSDIDYLRSLFYDEVGTFARLSGLPVDHWMTMRY